MDKKDYKKIAYVPQSGSVDWDFPTTVLDVVLMGRYGHLGWFKRPSKKDKELALSMIEKMGMSDYVDRQIRQLSGGQQQRVFLARALVQEADIYLMDEPFKGVDKTTEHAIISLLQEMKARGKTVIVVHHDLNTVPQYFDWVTMGKQTNYCLWPRQQIHLRTKLLSAPTARGGLYDHTPILYDTDGTARYGFIRTR